MEYVPESVIAEIFTHPKGGYLLVSYGADCCLTCSNAYDESIKQLCQKHGINMAELLQKLNN